MAFVITYRDHAPAPESPARRSSAVRSQLREVRDLLQREGCEVTRITPPPLSPSFRECALEVMARASASLVKIGRKLVISEIGPHGILFHPLRPAFHNA